MTELKNRAEILKAIKQDKAEKQFDSAFNNVLKKLSDAGKGKGTEFDNLKKDREIILEATKKHLSSFKLAHDSLKLDREFVLEALKIDWGIIKFCPKPITKDREIVLNCIKKSGMSIRYADKNLRADRELALQAVKNDLWAIKYISKELKDDKEIFSAYFEAGGPIPAPMPNG